MLNADDCDTPFHHLDEVWYTENGVDLPALIAGILDEGFEYEIVLGSRATTAHVTQLRMR